MQRPSIYTLLVGDCLIYCGTTHAYEIDFSLLSIAIHNSNLLSDSSTSTANTLSSRNSGTETQVNESLVSHTTPVARKKSHLIPSNIQTNEDVVTKIKFLEGKDTEKPNLYQAFLKYKSESENGNLHAMVEYGRLLVNIDNDASDTIAYKYFLKASKKGHVPDMVWMAWMHETERAPASTSKEALFFLREAANKGSDAAQFSLGRAYELGALGLQKDLDYAIKYYKLAASQYHPKAITAIAKIYEKNYGQYQDGKRAVSLYKLGARLNDKDALFNLGYMYFTGSHVPQDYVEAVKYYKIASDLGDFRAQNNLGNLYLEGKGANRDPELACSLFRQSALQENAYAMPNLGRCYQTGSGIKQNIEQSTYWYRRGSDLNNLESHYSLGMSYLTGEGVEKDIVRAVELFTKAAEQGHSTAAWRLGTIYAGDRGHQINYSESAKWFRLAVSKGNAAAMNDLAVNIINKNIPALAGEIPADLYEKSASAGNKYAMLNLARNLYSGRETKRDVKKAIEYLREPSSAGIIDSFVLLGDIYSNPNSDVATDYSKAIQYYLKSVSGDNEVIFKIFRIYTRSPELFSNEDFGSLRNGLLYAAQSADQNISLAAKRALFSLLEKNQLTASQTNKVFYWLTELALSGDEYSEFLAVLLYFRKNYDNKMAVRAIMNSEPAKTMVKNLSRSNGYFASFAKLMRFMLDQPLDSMTASEAQKAFEDYASQNDEFTKLTIAYTKADSQPDKVASLIRHLSDSSPDFSAAVICDLINKRLVMPLNIGELNMCISSH
ncbi:MAG: sel1 repeat family protein [Hydrogenophilales bacterium]|nr:sel1 repeat family protein [Hydrogenophilales bacterium]